LLLVFLSLTIERFLFHVKQAFYQLAAVEGAGRDGASLFHVEQRFPKGAIRSRDTDNWFKAKRGSGCRSNDLANSNKLHGERAFHVKQLASGQNVC
jgi:hypothetical protein